MSATPPGPCPAPPAPTRVGWFANRPLPVKFALLITAVVLALGGLLGSEILGGARVREAEVDLVGLEKAQTLVLQLDTRASELKVDGYKALLRENPAEQLPELADDIATPEEMLAELVDIPLTGEVAEAVAEVENTFGSYTAAISTFVNFAVADQAGTRVRWEEIQVANDLTDGAIGTAKDALAAENVAAWGRLNDAMRAAERNSIIAAGLGLLVLGRV